ncbi:MAG: hypothetical protein AUK48_01405 [Oscillatoriales cyanobacterium CG2_30_44_21]|nr:MAG: hypothetical protein AUK48_01405 [Oscillatoriales cyanobacterium CG2_30_44_21]
MNKFHKLLSTSAISLVALLPLASPADAISFTLNLNWQGLGSNPENASVNYFLTGSFTAEDINTDGFIRTKFEDFQDGDTSNDEVTNFAITFSRDTDVNLVTYDFEQITSDPAFVFNFDIGSGTILQSGTDDPVIEEVEKALYIGNKNSQFNGFSLDSFSVTTEGVLKLKDVGGIDNAISNENTSPKIGTLLIASAPAPVPFEFEASGGMLMLGAAWLWKKNLQKKATND